MNSQALCQSQNQEQGSTPAGVHVVGDSKWRNIRRLGKQATGGAISIRDALTTGVWDIKRRFEPTIRRILASNLP